MNMTGFSVIHESNLEAGKTYFLKTRYGAGFVLASESSIRGWHVELQPDVAFTPPLKKLRSGDIMLVPPGAGTFYEVTE